MESSLTPELEANFKAVLANADPLPEDDPFWDTLEGGCGFRTFNAALFARASATLAKMALEGRLK